MCNPLRKYFCLTGKRRRLILKPGLKTQRPCACSKKECLYKTVKTDSLNVKRELVKCGKKVVSSGLVAGAGGNISARSGRTIYLSASGMSLDEMTEDDYIGVDIDSEKTVDGKGKPTSETSLHLICYRMREDIQAIVHTHSPWAGGVISSGETIKPMFPEFVCDLEKVAHIGYVVPTTRKLAERVAQVIVDNNVVLMSNHGVLAVGSNLKEAYYRNLIIEDAAKALVAACIVGKPRFLTEEEIEEIKGLDSVRYRRQVSGNKP